MPTTRTPSNPPMWNTGFKIGPKKAFQAKEVWEIRFHLQNRGLVRDRALFDLAIDSKLRGFKRPSLASVVNQSPSPLFSLS